MYFAQVSQTQLYLPGWDPVLVSWLYVSVVRHAVILKLITCLALVIKEMSTPLWLWESSMSRLFFVTVVLMSGCCSISDTLHCLLPVLLCLLWYWCILLSFFSPCEATWKRLPEVHRKIISNYLLCSSLNLLKMKCHQGMWTDLSSCLKSYIKKSFSPVVFLSILKYVGLGIYISMYLWLA